jgi:hypothetical protein
MEEFFTAILIPANRASLLQQPIKLASSDDTIIMTIPY